MKSPQKWERSVLEEESVEAVKRFRDERLLEPLAEWKKTVNEHEARFRQLFRTYGLADPARLTPEHLVEIIGAGLGDCLRYLAGPPISADDLKVLAETTLAPQRIRQDPKAAARIIGIIGQAIDPTRFPWIAARRQPTKEEESAAILSSALLITAQRISTDRRTSGKNVQEASVKQYLVDLGFKSVASREIRTLADAPEPGEFCGETLVGSRKADIPVRLFDGRLMPIECKVSNSSTNSVKRLNNDAAVKAAIWHKEFGTKQVVPAAVLSGVFKVRNLEQAQEGGLALFWAHRLAELGKFIEATRTT